MTEQERIDNAYKNNPAFRKFMDDKALQRVNDLASAAHMLIQIAMTFEAETENILERYGLFVHDIKGRAKNLGKAYDQYQYAMSQYYSDKMENNFVVQFDKVLDDMYVYLGISKDWKPGQTDDHAIIGFQNALAHAIEEKGGRSYRYVERTPSGQVYMSTHVHGTAVRLPAQWFKGVKKGEIAKMVITPQAKF